MDKNQVFVTGYAKLPEGITAWELYRVIAIGILVDIKTGEVLDVDCTLSTSVAKNCVKSLLIGKNFNLIKEIENDFDKHYFGSAKKSLITSIRICNKKFKQVKVKLL